MNTRTNAQFRPGHDRRPSPLAGARLPMALLLALFAGCGGSSPVATVGPNAQKPSLESIQIGRLVDIYAYQRIDPANADRRVRFNRQLTLVATDVVVNPNLESDSLFDAAGEELPTANYELRPFDKAVGHDELVILWDNTDGSPEQARFDAAFSACQTGLVDLAPSFRGQNTQTRPIPVVPRNAALRLQFSGNVQVTSEFFAVNPSAIQLLEFKGDPNIVAPVDAFRILPSRIIVQGDRIVLDTTILGGEGQSGFTTSGLPESSDNVTANIRVAIPSRGSVVSSFYIAEDRVSDFNGVDSSGRGAVIRDFRSGNLADGAAGKLADSETPMIVASLPMGITAIDPVNRIITLNKRGNLVPVRGRFPFVEGPLEANDVPAGPVAVPTVRALRSGDVLTQELLVLNGNGEPEAVTVRAEILENLAIGTAIGGALPIGLSDSTVPGEEQGQAKTAISVRVASLAGGVDSTGVVHSFETVTDPLSNPEGRDCVLRALYYEDVPFSSGNLAVSDAAWRSRFLRVEPTLGTNGFLTPQSSVAVEFTKPLDLDQVDPTENLLLTNTSVDPVNGVSFADQLTDPKRATYHVVPARLADLGGDGTVLRLQPHMGFFHVEQTQSTTPVETYALHVKLGTDGVLDFGGNPVAIFDDPTQPLDSWSVDLPIDPAAPSNLVGWHTYLFRDADEDGSLPGSVDIFGQFRLQDGRLIAAAGVRFSRTADAQNLGAIDRIRRGECWDPDFDPTVPMPPLGVLTPQGFPTAPVDAMGNPHPGLLYWNPRMFDTIAPPNVPQVYEYWNLLPQNVGRIIEPLNPNGTRMQMRYIEDDFTLDYHQAAEMAIDVDQLYWSPFNDETVFYDVFDRFTMALSHSNKRPDEFFEVIPGDDEAMPPVLPGCQYDCPANSSALSTVFADNVLEGTEQVTVFEDKVYTINPNESFRSPLNVKYVPFPRFDRSYTWRDSRLVTIDSSGQVIGLGGAQTPTAPAPNNDWTGRISSPWIRDELPENAVNAGIFSLWCVDEGDFKGDQFHDHDPIALPLLVDFKVFPDSAANGIATAINQFQVAMLGPPSYGFPAAPGGYYDRQGAGCGVRPPWPSTRAQASGGEDLITGAAILIDPANQLTAQPSILKDAGLGNPARALFQAPARDGMMNWAQADFVRTVSTMTFGFLDTLQPQRAEFVVDPAGPSPTVDPQEGFPDLATLNTGYRVSDLITQLDPPQGRQPAGTSVVLELRGAETITNSTGPDALYNPTFDQGGKMPSDAYGTRGNLLNPNYACEAYRYSQANHTDGIGGSRDTPRVPATGLTRYVTEDQLPLIRNPATNLLPRYMNLRLTMNNNVDVTPALSPSLRSMSVIYRVVGP
ncbi:MAG: hypothetical protein KDE27_28040 [Planctomycetes bacterium]|nr:hypothetical protein [Planctomycetota bacterium]